MPNRYRFMFFISLALTITLGISLLFLPATRGFMQIFQQPGTALAWLALFLALAILVQQITNYKHGFMYMLLSKPNRDRIDKKRNPVEQMFSRRLGKTLKGSYWIFLVLVVLVSLQLIYGTFWGGISKDTKLLLESNSQIIEQHEQIMERLDKLINFMEANNAE